MTNTTTTHTCTDNGETYNSTGCAACAVILAANALGKASKAAYRSWEKAHTLWIGHLCAGACSHQAALEAKCDKAKAKYETASAKFAEAMKGFED